MLVGRVKPLLSGAQSCGGAGYIRPTILHRPNKTTSYRIWFYLINTVFQSLVPPPMQKLRRLRLPKISVPRSDKVTTTSKNSRNLARVIRTTKTVRTQDFIATVLGMNELVPGVIHVHSRSIPMIGPAVSSSILQCTEHVVFRLMQHIPTFRILTITCQQSEGWCRPNISRDTPIVLQQTSRRNHFAQDGAGAQQLYAMFGRSFRF